MLSHNSPCPISGLLASLRYMFFRHAVQLHLRNQGISKTAIDKALKGTRNFWWYEAAQQQFKLGWIYHTNKGFTVLFPIIAAAHLLVGWIKAVSIAMAIGAGVLCIMCEPMWMLTNLSGQRSNKKHQRTSRTILGLLFPAAMCLALVIYLFKCL